MQSDKIKQEHKPKNESYSRRLDFYWQFIAVYAVALIVYSLLRGSIAEGSFTIVLTDPVVILLSLFIIGTSVGLMVNYYKKNEVIIGKDFIIFKSRFREKKYTVNEIIRIAIGKEKITKVRGAYHVIKIKLNTRKRIVRIRPSSFWNEHELVKSVTVLKKSINK